MKPHRARRPTSSSPLSSLSAPLLILTSTLSFASHASTQSTSSLPDIDYSRMGTVALAGAFSGLDFYSQSPSSSASSSNISLSSNASTLFSRSTSGGSYSPSSTLTSIAQTNAGGRIDALCFFESGTGGNSSNGTVVVGGSFDQLGGVSSRNVAMVDLSSGKVSAMGQGVDGTGVGALFCDGGEGSGVVWIGGSLSSPVGSDEASSYGGGVLRYSLSSREFSPAPFKGLPSNSLVQSIHPNPSNSSLLFTGSFLTSFLTSTNSTRNVTTPTGSSETRFSPSGLPLSNVTVQSSGATAFTSSLSPIPLLGDGGLVDAEPTTEREGFTDPSVLLCPAGEDGKGNSWLARDDSVAQLNVNLYRAVVGSGVRIGNTFVDGRGTSTFSFVSVPDNNVLTLSYIDPSTSANMTCSSACPLSLDSDVPYQDFLFQGGGNAMTGFQLNMLEWKGAGPGLHLVQLLSDGAFSSASATNTSSCSTLSSSSSSSVITTSGNPRDWAPLVINTDIGGTTQTVLQSTVPLSSFPSLSSSNSLPALTFHPQITGTGNYTVTVLIPGCETAGDCPSRTSITASVYAYFNAPAQMTIIRPSQTDTRQVVYEGAVQKTDETFSPTVMLAMSSTPTGVNGDVYTVVADRVEFRLTSLDTTGMGSGTVTYANGTMMVGNGDGTTSSTQTANSSSITRSFGAYEWVRDSQTVDATSSLSNSTETSFDALGISLASALNSSSSNSLSSSISSSLLLGSTYYVAGTFSTESYSNILSFNSSSDITSLASSGLNGPVHAMISSSDTILFVGGEFTATAFSSSPADLLHLAKYDVSTSTWSPLAGGVNGPVTSLSLSSDSKTLTVGGNFTSLLATDGSKSSSGGFAVYDIASSSWASANSLLIGNISSLASSSSLSTTFLAGRVSGASSFSASGFAMISTKDNQPTLSSTDLGFESSSSSSQSEANTRRTLTARSSTVWLPSLSSPVTAFKRALSYHSNAKRQSSSSIAPVPRSPSPAPAVLSATFYTNSSASNEKLAIVGGNFTSSTVSGRETSNLAVYDESSMNVRAFNSSAVDGIVRSLAVVKDKLFVGGEFALRGDVTGDGFGVYNLKQGRWVEGLDSLSAETGNVSISQILPRPSTASEILLAGNFSSAGSLSSPSIVSFSTTSNTFSSLGSSPTGEIRAIDFAGSSSDLLFAAGSMSLGGRNVFAAVYTYGNQSWQALEGGEDVPGPATAIVVDNKNASNVFLSGVSTENPSSTYLLRWDGSSFSIPANASSLLVGSSTINQLSFVPLNTAHKGNGVIADDRMLLVSGSLALQGQGSWSSTLYDGSRWYPYIRATGQDGTVGSVSGFYSSERSFSFNIRKFLARGIVVLICLAIATGLIFLLVLLGVLFMLWRRNKDEPVYPVGGVGGEKSARSSSSSVYGDPSQRAPSSLLNHINAATEGVILGTPAGAAYQHQPNPSQAHGSDNEKLAAVPLATGAAIAASLDRGEDRRDMMSPDGTVVEGGGGYTDNGEEDDEFQGGRIVTARWSLVPEPGADRELAIKAGNPYLILNDSDAEWWLALDPHTGEQGAVPAQWML